MTINDGVASYLSVASYNNTSVSAVGEVTDDSSNSTFSGISNNFDTVEISAAGTAYQAQTESEESTGEVAKQGPPPNGGGKPPAGAGKPPAGEGKPPAGEGKPPAGEGKPPAGEGKPPAGEKPE